MTFSNINVSNPNDGLGDKLRDVVSLDVVRLIMV